MNLKVTPVVLCGGSGTRLWPLSRSGFPKQFLVLSGKKSLFQQAVDRLNGLRSDKFRIQSTIIVANEEHRFLILDQLRELPYISANTLLEPTPKNTAPAVTLAALSSIDSDEDSILVVAPADQTISDMNAFNEALENAIHAASDGSIIVLGIKPTRPDTGYGYIEKVGGADKDSAYVVEEFAEKPNLEKAKYYVNSGHYFWNSGIFIFKASVWLNAIKFFRPDIYNLTLEAFNGYDLDGSFVRPDFEVFQKIPPESVDFAVLEKCPGSKYPIKMIGLDAGWNDLGAWDSVWQVSDKDENQNSLKGDVLVEGTTGSIVNATHRLVGVVGLDNVMVLETADAILVANKNSAQQVKGIVEQLKASGRDEHVLHRKVVRPWGWYDTLDIGERFKVKRIQVNPGASLSLQRHKKRAEHWVVVRGRAEIICADKRFILNENESTFIPQGYLHRLTNPFNEPLEIIEVQSGGYLGEDDIERFDDYYGRKG